jgi:hypothetical protein
MRPSPSLSRCSLCSSRAGAYALSPLTVAQLLPLHFGLTSREFPANNINGRVFRDGCNMRPLSRRKNSQGACALKSPARAIAFLSFDLPEGVLCRLCFFVRGDWETQLRETGRHLVQVHFLAALLSLKSPGTTSSSSPMIQSKSTILAIPFRYT